MRRALSSPRRREDARPSRRKSAVDRVGYVPRWKFFFDNCKSRLRFLDDLEPDHFDRPWILLDFFKQPSSMA